MKLIAILSSGKGTWGHVSRLIQDGEWEKVFLITNEFGKENFSTEKPHEFILVDMRQGLEELRNQITESLKGKIQDTEVAVNIVSGTGKEHIALISAILKLGLGLRFYALTRDGIKEI